MCLRKVTNFACGHNKLDDRDRCAAAIHGYDSSAAAFFLVFACPNHESMSSSVNHGCGIGHVYCGVTPEGQAVDQAYNKRGIIVRDIANLNAQIDGLSQDLQWRGLQLRIAADAQKESRETGGSTMPSVGRDARFLHTKAIGVPFLQERSTLIEQYWTLTTFIESCEGHWWQVLNQQRIIMQARQRQQRLATATGVSSANRIAMMEQQQQQSSSPGMLVNSPGIPRRKDSGVYPGTRTIPSNSFPTNVQKPGRKRRQARSTPEAPHPPQRKRKVNDRPNITHVGIPDDHLPDSDTDFLTGVRRSVRTSHKKVDYSQVSSSQSPSREPTPAQNSELDSAFSPPRSIVSDASTSIHPESTQAVGYDQVNETMRTSYNHNTSANTPGPRDSRTDNVGTRQDSSTRTPSIGKTQDHNSLNAEHLAFGQTKTEWPVMAVTKSMNVGIDPFRPVSLGVGHSHSQPTQGSFVSHVQQPSNTRGMLHPSVVFNALATPEAARSGALVKLKVPPSVLAVQKLRSCPSQQVMRQEAVVLPRAQNADTFQPSPLMVPTSEELVVTPIPYGATPAAHVAVHSYDAGFTPDGALLSGSRTIDDESFHFNSAPFDEDDDGISYTNYGVVEPDFLSTGMGFNNTDNSQLMHANSSLAFGTQSIQPNALVPLQLHFNVEQPLPEVSGLRADVADANIYGNSDISALSEIDWALDFQS